MEGDRVRQAHIGLGGVASVPWRALVAATVLEGKALTESMAAEAAEAAFAQAVRREHNAYKTARGKRTLVRALLETRDIKVHP